MMNPSLGQEEMGDLAARAAKTPGSPKTIFGDLDIAALQTPELKSAQTAPNVKEDMEGGPSVNVIDSSLRKPTVPGQFHQTKDPFSADGMYGGARIGLVDVNQIKS